MKKFFKNYKYDIIINSIVAIAVGVHFLPFDEIKHIFNVIVSVIGAIIVVAACFYFLYKMGQKFDDELKKWDLSYWSFLLLIYIYIFFIYSAYRSIA